MKLFDKFTADALTTRPHAAERVKIGSRQVSDDEPESMGSKKHRHGVPCIVVRRYAGSCAPVVVGTSTAPPLQSIHHVGISAPSKASEREVQCDITRTDTEQPQPENPVDNVAMLDHDALWSPSGAGGVNHVGKVVRRDLHLRRVPARL